MDSKPSNDKKPAAKDKATVLQLARDARIANPYKSRATRAQRIAGRREISRNESYPYEEFMKRTGLTRQAFREATLTGLEVTEIGDSCWITGEEWFRWLQATKQSKSK